MPSGERLPRTLIAVTAVLLAARLVAGAIIHLTEDEAYYRLWSTHLALGYYDHPPMIAWWVAAGRAVAGDTALGVRLMPILASATTPFLVYDMACQAGTDRATAQRAGVWFNAMLLPLAGGFLAVPDAPASLFFAAALCCALRARTAPAWWLAAGVAAGLACLSKYSALFIAPGMVIWLAATPAGRAQLRAPWPWLAALAAAALFALNVAWNADHQWLTFAKQFGRIAGRGLAPRYLIELVAGQFLLLNPLIALFAGAALFLRRREDGADLTPFFALMGPFAAYLVIHSLHDRVQAHWPAPLYSLAAVCAAVAAGRLAQRRAWRALAEAAPAAGFALGAAALALVALPAPLLGKADIAQPVRGWPAFAARLETLRRAQGAAWTGTLSYGLAAQLAAERTAPLIELGERDRWGGLDLGPAPNLSRPGLVVDLARRLDASRLARCFTQVRPLGPLLRSAPTRPYAAFMVAGPKRDVAGEGCPAGAGQGA